MLTQGQLYEWNTNPNTEAPGQRFVEAETIHEILRGPGRHCLIAADGHRIPFPRRVLDSNAYRQSRTGCRVVLFLNTGDRRYHNIANVDYVMWIHLIDTGVVSRRTQGQAVAVAGAAGIPTDVSSALNTAGVPTDLRSATDMGVQRIGDRVAPGRPTIPGWVTAAANVFLYGSPMAHESPPWTERIELSRVMGRADNQIQARDEAARMLSAGADSYSSAYQANVYEAIVCYELLAP